MSQTTKRALEASLKKLLLQKPLNKITINDITEDCGVNRMTFYYHFRDIYDLVDWILVEDAAQVADQLRDYDSWKEGFAQLLELVRENKPLVLNVYHSVSREQLEVYLYKTTGSLLRSLLDDQCKDIAVKEEDKRFITDFYKYALVGMILEWVGRDMKDDPRAMTERLDLLVHGQISRALERFRTDRPASREE